MHTAIRSMAPRSAAVVSVHEADDEEKVV